MEQDSNLPPPPDVEGVGDDDLEKTMFFKNDAMEIDNPGAADATVQEMRDTDTQSDTLGKVTHSEGARPKTPETDVEKRGLPSSWSTGYWTGGVMIDAKTPFEPSNQNVGDPPRRPRFPLTSTALGRPARSFREEDTLRKNLTMVESKFEQKMDIFSETLVAQQRQMQKIAETQQKCMTQVVETQKKLVIGLTESQNTQIHNINQIAEQVRTGQDHQEAQLQGMKGQMENFQNAMEKSIINQIQSNMPVEFRTTPGKSQTLGDVSGHCRSEARIQKPAISVRRDPNQTERMQPISMSKASSIQVPSTSGVKRPWRLLRQDRFCQRPDTELPPDNAADCNQQPKDGGLGPMEDWLERGHGGDIPTPHLPQYQEELDDVQETSSPKRHNTIERPEKMENVNDSHLSTELIKMCSQLCAKLSKETPGTSSKSRIKPDVYNGNTPWQDYRAYFEICGEANKWSEEDKRQFLATSLRGPAQQMVLEMGQDYTYDQLLLALEKRFGPGGKAEVYEAELVGRIRKPKETLQTLGQDIRRLTALAYPEMSRAAQDRLARRSFEQAILEEEIRRAIHAKECNTLDKAIEVALKEESYIESERIRKGQKPKFRVNAIDTEEEYCNSISTPDNKEDVFQKMAQMVKQMQQAVQETCTRNLEKMVDLIKLTKSDSTNSVNMNIKPKCFYCHKPGHRIADCYSRKRAEERDKAAQERSSQIATVEFLSLQGNGVQSSKDTQKIVAHGIVCDTNVSFLVDSGAASTIMSSTVYQNIPKRKRPQLKPPKKTILQAGGQLLHMEGVIPVSLKIDGHVQNLEVVVADIHFEGILGTDFLAASGAVLNYRECKMTFEPENPGSFDDHQVDSGMPKDGESEVKHRQGGRREKLRLRNRSPQPKRTAADRTDFSRFRGQRHDMDKRFCKVSGQSEDFYHRIPSQDDDKRTSPVKVPLAKVYRGRYLRTHPGRDIYDDWRDRCYSPTVKP